MELDEAIKKLNAAGLIVEDTDELDDADLPVGMNAKQYHKQKAKMMSLLDKIQMALNQQSEEAQAKVEDLIPPEVKKHIKDLEKDHKDTFSGDYKGNWFMDKKNVDAAKKKNKLRNETETLLWCFVEGMKKHGNTYNAEQKKQRFIKWWLPNAQKLLKGGKLKVYRGMCFYDDDLEENFKKILATCRRNVLSRNSWTYNEQVAKDYAGDADCGIVISMDCSLDMTNIYYSAWLEGYWAGCGSNRTKGAANDEINLKQMLNVSNVKISHYSTSDSYSKKLFDKYFCKTK